MEYPLEVPGIGQCVVSNTGRDITKDQILQRCSVSLQNGKHCSRLALAMEFPRRRPNFVETPNDRIFPIFEVLVKLALVIECVFRIRQMFRGLLREKLYDFSIPDWIDSSAPAAFQIPVPQAQRLLIVRTTKTRNELFRTSAHRI